MQLASGLLTAHLATAKHFSVPCPTVRHQNDFNDVNSFRSPCRAARLMPGQQIGLPSCEPDHGKTLWSQCHHHHHQDRKVPGATRRTTTPTTVVSVTKVDTHRNIISEATNFRSCTSSLLPCSIYPAAGYLKPWRMKPEFATRPCTLRARNRASAISSDPVFRAAHHRVLRSGCNLDHAGCDRN